MKSIAIVTGASSGIGKEFFLSLNEHKENLDEIWVVARSQEKLEALRALTTLPVRIFPIDLSQPDGVKSLEDDFQTEEIGRTAAMV
jgi:short-subunit dehydrogenase